MRSSSVTEAEAVSAAASRPRTLARLLGLWRVYAYLDLIWIARDVRSAFAYYLSDLILNAAAVAAVLLLAARFEGLAGWTKPQVTFMLGYSLVVVGLLDAFCSYNVKLISRRVGRGQLDHTLIQPQPLWMALLTEGFAPFSASGALLTGAALLAWAGGSLSLTPSPAWVAALLANLLASSAVELSFSFLWGSLAFWAPRAAEEISSSSLHMLDRLKVFPLDGLPPSLLGGLLSVVPAGFVAWYPCRALLGLDRSPEAILITPLAAALFSAVAGLTFARGLRHYGRVGSQRYLSLGHRS